MFPLAYLCQTLPLCNLDRLKLCLIGKNGLFEFLSYGGSVVPTFIKIGIDTLVEMTIGRTEKASVFLIYACKGC